VQPVKDGAGHQTQLLCFTNSELPVLTGKAAKTLFAHQVQQELNLDGSVSCRSSVTGVVALTVCITVASGRQQRCTALADFLETDRVITAVPGTARYFSGFFGFPRDKQCDPPNGWTVLVAGFAYKPSHFTPGIRKGFVSLLLPEPLPLIDESRNGTRRCQPTQLSRIRGWRSRTLNFLPEFRLDAREGEDSCQAF
jgi:hypothetical protein